MTRTTAILLLLAAGLMVTAAADTARSEILMPIEAQLD